MKPEQREELKQAAMKVGKASYSDPMTVREDFSRKANPSAILSLIAQVEALTVPQGWKLVPMEPDQSMCEQGYYEFDPDGQPDAANMWRAMIRAAPTIPAIPGTKEGA